jgi:hypothetical protein
MKQVRLSSSQWNPLLLDFAGHYGFAAKTCRPYRPRTKGKVERAIRYLDDNFLAGRRFADLEDLNAQGQHWCELTANLRVHGTTGQRPVDLWPAENLAAMTLVPAYRLALPVSRQVDAEAMVAFQRSRYSVGPEHVGKTVSVLAEVGQIIIRSDDMILAQHVEAAKPGSYVMASDHAEALWKLATPPAGIAPPPPWKIHFQEPVATRPLDAYAEVADE